MSKCCEENQNGLCPEWMSNSLREIQKQKEGANQNMDELERKSYECAKSDVVKLRIQNEDLRKQVSELKLVLNGKSEELRTRDENGDVLVRMLKLLTGPELAEVNITFRTKKYFDE